MQRPASSLVHTASRSGVIRGCAPRPPRRRWRNMRGLPRNRCGGVAAEFAIILPVLLLLSFGIIQIGLLTYTYSSMHTSARNAARLMAFGATAEQAGIAARAQLPPWIAAGATITPTALEVNEDGVDVARVTISAAGRTAAIIGYVPMPDSITADVTMPRVADR
ncbi:MAG: TadE/TadG family type IV pilus assembly protein [Thermaurantiacus sp.]